MRIGIVTEYFYPTLGGVQEHVYHFAREARRQGHTATVITSRVEDLPFAPEPQGVDVIRLGRSMALEANGSVGRVTVGLNVGQQLSKLLVKGRFDVVHVHAPLTPVLPMLAIRRTELPVVATYHTNFKRSRLMATFQGACQSIVDRIDANVAVSDVCIRALKPYVAGKFQIVPNGVDCSYFASGRRQGWAKGERNILFIGRLETRCGLDRVFRAWPMLAGRANARLIVLGDGPDRARLEAMAKEFDVPATFFGAIREKRPDFFASADLLVCPTTIASFGITLLEGMAAGLPIVASDIDGFREILTHGQEGLLVDTDNPEVLSDALADLLNNPDRRRQLGEAGRKTAARYDWPVVTEQILNVYRSVGAAS
jgi:phosphatidylinositol alpha-mannosyltransferase